MLYVSKKTNIINSIEVELIYYATNIQTDRYYRYLLILDCIVKYNRCTTNFTYLYYLNQGWWDNLSGGKTASHHVKPKLFSKKLSKARYSIKDNIRTIFNAICVNPLS